MWTIIYSRSTKKHSNISYLLKCSKIIFPKTGNFRITSEMFIKPLQRPSSYKAGTLTQRLLMAVNTFTRLAFTCSLNEYCVVPI